MAYKIYLWNEFKNEQSELAQAWIEAAAEHLSLSVAYNYETDIIDGLWIPSFCIYGCGENEGHGKVEGGDSVEIDVVCSEEFLPSDRIYVAPYEPAYDGNPFMSVFEMAYDLDNSQGHYHIDLLCNEEGEQAAAYWKFYDNNCLWIIYEDCQAHTPSVTGVKFALRDNYNPNGTATGEIIEEYYYPAKLPTPTLSIACDDAVVATITETESATTFHLEYRRSGTSTWNEYSGHIQSEESNSETVDLTDLLTGGKVYEFRAYCSDSSGEYENSAYSAVVSFKLFSKVAYKSVKSRTTSSISFFTTNLGLTSNTTWIAQYKKRGTDTWLTATTSNASRQLTVSSKTTLTADSVYDFRIRLKRSEGESTWFYVAQTTRSNKTAPAPSCTAGSTTIAATWTPPTGYYWYQLSAILNGTVVARNAWTQATSDTLTGLTPGKTYTVRVQYRITAEGDAYENDSFRGTVDVTTLQQLAAPTGLIATNITSNSARLAWNAVNNANDYQVEFRKSGTSSWLVANE